MVKGGEIFFSEGCPQAGDLVGRPISASDLVVHVHPREKYLEYLVAFGHPNPESEDETLSSEPLVMEDLPGEGNTAQIITEIEDNGPKIRRIGEGLCRAIADCKGPQIEADGSRTCLAYNGNQLMRLIMEV